MENINNLRKENKNLMTKSEALNEIIGIEQEIRMGPMDVEGDLLNDIRQKLRKGELEPAEAVKQARAIEKSRSSHYR